MSKSKTYLLEKDGLLLGQLTLRNVEMFAFHCDFQPTPEFKPYQVLFDKDAEIGELMNQGNEEEYLDRLIDITDRIQELGLSIRRVGGGIYRKAIIHIEGNRADFCPLDPTEEPYDPV